MGKLEFHFYSLLPQITEPFFETTHWSDHEFPTFLGDKNTVIPRFKRLLYTENSPKGDNS
jgi:hypothetical protein